MANAQAIFLAHKYPQTYVTVPEVEHSFLDVYDQFIPPVIGNEHRWQTLHVSYSPVSQLSAPTLVRLARPIQLPVLERPVLRGEGFATWAFHTYTIPHIQY